MKKSLNSFLCFLLIISFVFNSCRKDSDEKEEMISEVGTWSLSDVEYYFDGNLLDYKEHEIDIWTTCQREDHWTYVSHGGFILNGDGTGKAFGLGEFGTDEFDLTYTKEGNDIHIELNYNGNAVSAMLKLEKKRLIMERMESDIYGWALNNSDEVCGNDGKCTHSLLILQIYTK